MAQLAVRRWIPRADGPALPRQDRRGCDYRVYLPDQLAGRALSLYGHVAADVADAERAIVALDGSARALVDTEALARLLLRAESVASSKIEGLEIGPRRLLVADAEREQGNRSNDQTAVEVLANVDALRYGVEVVSEGVEITLDLILEMHRRLLASTRIAQYAGVVRTEQNWIGGSSYNPCTAAFVPPPPESLEALLSDLLAFCNADDLSPIAQAAMAHAQFETIHPFADGNGRIGRALIHLVLRRRGLVKRTLPPISLILSTQTDAYIAGLAGTRYDGDPTSEAAVEGINRWVGEFAVAATRAVADADGFEQRINVLEGEWRERLGRVRARSATDLLLKQLPAMPLLTVDTAAQSLGRTFGAVNRAVADLVQAGILTAARDTRRNRVFEARELIDVFTDFERALASPAGDTRIEPPVRPVPYRRQN